MKPCPICKIAILLAGIGALNWGLVALFNLNLVTKLLGEMTTASKGVYILVGLSGIISIASILKLCPPCNKNCS